MVAVVLAIIGCGLYRSPYVFEVPEGYVGWVRIRFDRSDSPALPNENGKLVLRIGKDGRLSTSSNLKIGEPFDEYYYTGRTLTKLPCTQLHGGGMIWGGGMETVSSGTNKSASRVFFVGTEAEYLNQRSVHE